MRSTGCHLRRAHSGQMNRYPRSSTRFCTSHSTDGRPLVIALAFPGRDLTTHAVDVAESLAQALTGQHRQFALSHVEPTPVFGCEVELELPGDPSRLGGRECNV